MTDENFSAYWSKILHAPGRPEAGSAGSQSPASDSLR
jgi:hypothetical protein